MKKPFPFFTLCLITSSIILSGCIVQVGGKGDYHNGNEVSSIFGSLEVSEGKRVGNISSVNGSITLENHVTANEVSAVNGNITIGDSVTVSKITTVNGDIEAGQQLLCNGATETVNGSIRLGNNSELWGDVATVNGDIHLPASSVHGDITTQNGDISLTEGTTISGDIVFTDRDDNSWGNDHSPILTISSTVTIEGDIILDRPVVLNIENPTLQQKVHRRYSQQ